MTDIIASMTMYGEDPAMLTRAIDSFLNTKLDVQLIQVDNSPTDAFRGRWTDERITYIHNGKNLGFAAGHNVGIRESLKRNSKYHLMLNPDIYFEPGTLEKLFDYMENHPDTGLILPRVLYPDGTVQQLYRLLPTPSNLIFRRFVPPPFNKLFKRGSERYQLIGMDLDKIHEIPYLSGCFMFLRSKALEEVGIFDERFFLYMDDVDLSRRVLRKYKNIYYPHVTVYHEHMQTSYKNSKFLRYHMKSAIRYFNKWGWIFDRERKKINREAYRRIMGA